MLHVDDIIKDYKNQKEQSFQAVLEKNSCQKDHFQKATNTSLESFKQTLHSVLLNKYGTYDNFCKASGYIVLGSWVHGLID